MARREVLLPGDATTLGERKLRELALTQTFAAIARRARVDETTVRRWTKGEAMPSPEMRGRLKDTLGIDVEWWATDVDDDAYVAEPATTKRGSSRPNRPDDARGVPTRPR